VPQQKKDLRVLPNSLGLAEPENSSQKASNDDPSVSLLFASQVSSWSGFGCPLLPAALSLTDFVAPLSLSLSVRLVAVSISVVAFAENIEYSVLLMLL